MKSVFKKIFLTILGLSAGFFIATIAIQGYSTIWQAVSQKINPRNTPEQMTSTAGLHTVPSSAIENVPALTHLTFVGDIMLDRGVRSSVEKNFGGDYGRLFENVSDLKNADILFANLEGDVSDIGHNVGSKFSFRMDPKIVPVLKDAGFDIVSFANNHVGDWSQAAFDDTRARLTKEGILYIGAGDNKATASSPKIIEENGTKIGFLGFTDVGPDWLAARDTTSGVLLASDPDLDEIIKNAKTQVDTLIVSFHFGVEYHDHTSRQEDLAHRAIDDGATLVIGSHPHIAQDLEKYKDGLIAYSLGNFIFDQYFSEKTMQGMVLDVTLSGSAISDYKIRTVHLNKFYQPENITDDASADTGDTDKKIETGYPNEESVLPKKVTFSCPTVSGDFPDYSLANIGQATSLPYDNYVPSNLVELPKDNAALSLGICVKKEVALSLEKMIADAQSAGLSIRATSGFRSFETQADLLKNWVDIRGSEAYARVAKPGHSEHQLGVAVDLSGSTIGYLSAVDKFADSPEFIWLSQNANRYGFVMSYPPDKEDVTGYEYEPWHYRYVGVATAMEIGQKNITLAEYLSQQQQPEKPKEKFSFWDLFFKKVSAEDGISIGFVGDIVPGKNASSNIFSDVLEYTKKPDLMIGNLEGVITDKNISMKCTEGQANCFAFGGDENFLELLKNAGFDDLNNANNHAHDFGDEEINSTINKIKNAGLEESGTKNEITYITKNNIKVAIVGFSTYAWTTDMNDIAAVSDLVKTAKKNSDITVVVFHGGAEGTSYMHVPIGTETFLGENRGDVRSFAHEAIDAGADLVLGSGPHVLRGMEWYKGKLIAYSLGNFASANDLSLNDFLQTSAMLSVNLTKDGTLTSGKVYSINVDKGGIPHPDSTETGSKLISILSRQDFDGNGVVIDENGNINALQ